MKLKNKRTGEIIDIYKGEITLHYNQGRKTIHFKHLEDLDEWEDVPEEPKDNNYWYIDDFGRIQFSSEILDEVGEHPNNWMARKLFGNYFGTREEAEKAVEKLKAWKRLKDKGFRFMHNKVIGEYGNVSYRLNYPATAVEEKDLDLLFGDEE